MHRPAVKLRSDQSGQFSPAQRGLSSLSHAKIWSHRQAAAMHERHCKRSAQSEPIVDYLCVVFVSNHWAVQSLGLSMRSREICNIDTIASNSCSSSSLFFLFILAQTLRTASRSISLHPSISYPLLSLVQTCPTSSVAAPPSSSSTSRDALLPVVRRPERLCSKLSSGTPLRSLLD